MNDLKYDFGGWATKYNVACSDGRTILTNAFQHCDDQQVPLVWNHNYSGPDSIIGKAILKHADVGVYAYCEFNDTDTAKTAKNLVKHGDITALSIYANKLQQQGGRVIHGDIKEVSLVLAGANPGASIQEVLIHGDIDETSATIYNDEEGLELYHAGCKPRSSKDDEESQNETKKKKVIKHQKSSDEALDNIKEAEEIIKESEEKKEESAKSVAEIYDSMTDEQKAVVAIIAEKLLEEKNEEDDNMKHNVFDQNKGNGAEELMHSEFITESIKDAKKYGSLRESFLAHAANYGIENIDQLFPTEQLVTKEPGIYDNNNSWVNVVFNGAKKSPFSRLKSIYADLTADDARAKGYVKGNLKKDEVFKLLKRVTSPTTIYKKQKLDRDDILDITDFDVVAFMKKEMRLKLDEEIARAILIGDGRDALSEEKIKEANIRPVYNDSDLYTIKATIGSAGELGAAHAFIKTVIKAMAQYEGDGVPTLFVEPELLADMLLIEDKNGRFVYENESVLAKTLRVKEIVQVPAMRGLKRDVDGNKKATVRGIVYNPADYTLGADKGGAVSMFDDFDIDYNQQKFLMETRCSGSLLKPKTAITIEDAPTA